MSDFPTNSIIFDDHGCCGPEIRPNSTTKHHQNAIALTDTFYINFLSFFIYSFCIFRYDLCEMLTPVRIPVMDGQRARENLNLLVTIRHRSPKMS
jgi:hypothetical protein